MMEDIHKEKFGVFFHSDHCETGADTKMSFEKAGSCDTDATRDHQSLVLIAVEFEWRVFVL